LAETGNPAEKTGMAYLVYSATQDMPKDTVYFNSDGSDLIIAQCGALDIQTELGRMLVRPMEIAVLPRGIRYRVTLPDGHARGYICSLYQGAWQLPELGPIGSCSLANVRDFEVPTAHFEGRLDASTGKAVDAAPGKEWTVLTRFVRRLYKATQKHSPFDVVAWHGTYYPYKYDLAKFSVLGSVLFDHPDPSIFTVLTAPSHRIPGHAVVDFAVFPPRYAVMEDTYYLPYYHRNSLSEFAGAIIRPPANPTQKDEMDAFWQAPGDFKPLGASLNNSMVTHGSTKEQHEHAMERSTAPEKIDDHPFMIFLLEAENMMGVSSWAGSKAAGKSWREKKGEGEGSKL
jgi:homogentisate 1,2-dioxygenase